jgi:hypothetical protein
MSIHESITIFIKSIKENPIVSVITVFNIIGILFTVISNTHVDLYVTSQEVRANAQQIAQLQQSESTDHDSIIILQQIAKDNVSAQQNFSNELTQLNSNFSQYLLNKVK